MNDKMRENMTIYDAVRAVPDSAVKKITGGAYGAAGLSDINPQWRIERMTALFGPVGMGWTWEPVEITEREGVLYGHVIVRYRDNAGQLSAPIHGYGGTKFGGRDDSDIYKSTMTDAVSNALRYLGVGADVWYSAIKASSDNQFDTKYSAPPQKVETISQEQAAEIRAMISDLEWAAMETKYGKGLGLMPKTMYAGIVEKIKARKEGKK
ncbi:MAG: hypothetical protein IJJ23_03710 [Clostridia bacterium]|nr:hypothetical protein [Clostridia bacterium]